ncbi:MAG TPA: MBL fold metallo-hydrolase [bacterium]|nr:MBL fold metallo-hydrolase [bacterium]HPN42357.1 MBL fold metallo-hydrolase [bacterium]
MIVKTVPVGPLEVNCYILGCKDTAQAVIIDPGDDEEQILAAIQEDNFKITHILLTHGHADHIAAVAQVQQATGAKIFIHQGDHLLVEHAKMQAAMFDLRVPAPFKIDAYLQDGEKISFGKHELTVLSTPGHSPGCVCFLNNGYVFSGDTLFWDSIGRTDLPGGSHTQILESIRNKLFTLSPETRVYPGHGLPTTIAREIKCNPFINQ